MRTAKIQWNVLFLLGLVYNIVEQPDDDSDYGSDYDSLNDDPDDVFEKIAKYWLDNNVQNILHYVAFYKITELE